MVATMPAIMKPHYLDLTKRKERPDDIEANYQSLKQLFTSMPAERKLGITEVYTQGSFLSEKDLHLLADHCPHITKLRLRNAYRIGDSALKIIAERFNSSLTELNVCHASNCADQSEFVGGECQLRPGMRGQVEHITDAGVLFLLDQCHHLTRLNLSGTAIKAKTLSKIANQRQLTYLVINPCCNLLLEEPRLVDDLLRKRPDLTIEDSRGIHRRQIFSFPSGFFAPLFHLLQSIRSIFLSIFSWLTCKCRDQNKLS